MAATATSLNQGNSVYGRNSSLSRASSQTPCAEICVTSTPEVLVPRANDPAIVVLHDRFSFLELLARQPVIPSELQLRFQPELCLTATSFNVNVAAWLLF